MVSRNPFYRTISGTPLPVKKQRDEDKHSPLRHWQTYKVPVRRMKWQRIILLPFRQKALLITVIVIILILHTSNSLALPNRNDNTDGHYASTEKSLKNAREKQQRSMGQQHPINNGDSPGVSPSVPPSPLDDITPSPWAGSPAFPDYNQFLALDEKSELLPDIIHIPFEEAVADMTLEGWEDEWLSDGHYNVKKWGKLKEPKLDYVYTWVNGSDVDFHNTMHDYELNSTLNDPEGEWLKSHGVNRYRDWDELRYSIRSIEKYAKSFRNKIQVLVNAVKSPATGAAAAFVGKQRPTWLKDDSATNQIVEILSQEDFFSPEESGCLPTFNSLTIENQIHNTPSDVDRLVALSDDMLLGKPHAASDVYSPLFGPTMGFKSNSYNTLQAPSDSDARRFGEKPFLIYTSWLLNRRFGERKRKGQVHFGHSISRSLTREAMATFPAPSLKSVCLRFRGETGFQLYSWYATFHYTMERHREALLWSYLMLRSDTDENGNLGWEERENIMADLEAGMANEGKTTFRERAFYRVEKHLVDAGLEPPKVNIETLWTSLDGPYTIHDLECWEFNVDECLAPGFSSPLADQHYQNAVFSSATIFDRVAHRDTHCGDCFIKLLLNQVEKGLSPMLPFRKTQLRKRDLVLKALHKYQYSIVNPDALFVMVTDAEQLESTLIDRFLRRRGQIGQLCINDDVSTEEETELVKVKETMIRLFQGLFPDKTPFEIGA